MSTGTVARRLIELCRAGQFNRAFEELYAADARSIEMNAGAADASQSTKVSPATRRGKAIAQDWVKVHSVLVSDPLIAGPFFTIAMGVDATYKDGARRAVKEVCVYEVRNDKIVSEQSFCAAAT